MSKLSWITGKGLEREPTSLPEEKYYNYIAVVRKREMLAATKVKMSDKTK